MKTSTTPWQEHVLDTVYALFPVLLILLALGGMLILFLMYLVGATSAESYYHKVTILAVPHASPSWFFDGGWVDTQRHVLYQADISHKRVDIFDLQQNILLGTIDGMTGIDPSGTDALNGPNYIIGIASDAIAVSNGDSTIRIFNVRDLRHPVSVATISTHGNKRINAMAYDANRHMLAVVNSNDSPPFVTFIDSRTDQVIKQLPFANAAGLDDITFDTVSQHFFLAVRGKSTSADPYGAIAEISPFRLKVITTTHIPYLCDPAGITFDEPADVLAINCSMGNPLILEYVGRKEAQMTQIKDCDRGDFVAFAHGHFFFVEVADIAGARLVVTDLHGQVQQVISVDPGTHSVTVDGQTNHIYVPEAGTGIVVLAE